MKDKIIEQVTKKFQQRSEVGIKKYGITLDKEKNDLILRLNHLQEELMDSCAYIEKLISILHKKPHSVE